MPNNHVIAWLRNRLLEANKWRLLTEKSRVQKLLIKELDRQLA